MTHFEVGSVHPFPGRPGDADPILDDLGRILGVEPRRVNRFGLAGPNEILHVLLSADLWDALVPWARQVGFGAAGFVGGQIAARFFKTKLERKLERTQAELSTIIHANHEKISENFRNLQMAIERSNAFDDHSNYGVETWDFRFGFRSAERPEEDPMRSMIGMSVGTKSLTDVADAVLALSIAGPHVEALVSDYFEAKTFPGEIRRLSGDIQVETDGTITISLRNLKEDHRPKLLKITPAQYLSGPAGD